MSTCACTHMSVDGCIQMYLAYRDVCACYTLPCRKHSQQLRASSVDMFPTHCIIQHWFILILADYLHLFIFAERFTTRTILTNL
jgi:hypothetical protein